MGMRIIKWDTLLQGQSVCHMARTVYRVGYTHPFHGHDFAEIYWVESGQLLQRGVRGEIELAAGDLIVVDPAFLHELSNPGRNTAVMINIAFPAQILQQLHDISPELDTWFLPSAGGCRTLRLAQDDLEPLAQMAATLAHPDTDRIELVAFLLEIIRRLRKGAQSAKRLRPWLSELLTRLEQPAVLAGGLGELVRISGRTRQHLARVLKAELGVSPTELVASARMRYSAGQLRLSEKNVLTICHECGLSNPTHFYRLFKKTYGQTPNQYRRRL